MSLCWRKERASFYYAITKQKIRICTVPIGKGATWVNCWFWFILVLKKYIFVKEKNHTLWGETLQSLSHLDLTRRQLVTIVATSFGEKFFSSRLLRRRKTCLALTTLDITFWEVKIRHLMHQNASRSLHVIPHSLFPDRSSV